MNDCHDLQCRTVPDTLAQKQNLLVPGAFLGSSELDVIRNGIRKLGLESLDATDKRPLPGRRPALKALNPCHGAWANKMRKPLSN